MNLSTADPAGAAARRGSAAGAECARGDGEGNVKVTPVARTFGAGSV